MALLLLLSQTPSSAVSPVQATSHHRPFCPPPPHPTLMDTHLMVISMIISKLKLMLLHSSSNIINMCPPEVRHGGSGGPVGEGGCGLPGSSPQPPLVHTGVLLGGPEADSIAEVHMTVTGAWTSLAVTWCLSGPGTRPADT